MRRNIVTLVFIAIVLATSHTQIVQAVDSIIDGNIVLSGPGQDGARDIRTTTNTGGLRFYNGSSLTASPNGAAIQFFGNGSTGFPGQAFIDSGANNNAAIIFRTAPTSGAITERMRITAQGGIAAGAGAVATRLGEKSVANGSFATAGDAQGSTFVLRGVVPPDTLTPVDLIVDGVITGISIPEDHALTLEAVGTIFHSTGTAIGFSCSAVAKNVNGVVDLAGAVSNCPLIGDPYTPSPLVSFALDAANTSVIMEAQVVSVSFTDSFRVVAVVRTSEVGFPIP